MYTGFAVWRMRFLHSSRMRKKKEQLLGAALPAYRIAVRYSTKNIYIRIREKGKKEQNHM